MPVGDYGLFRLLEDYGVRMLSYGNGSGGQFFGPYRSFLIDVDGSTEFFSLSLSSYGRNGWSPDKKPPKTCICVAHDDDEMSHHALQLVAEDNTVLKSNVVQFYHHGRIAIGRIGSGKKDDLIILPIQYAGNADANDIYMATFGTCVVSEGEACLDRIVEHARKLKLYDIEYRTIGEQKDLIKSGLRWELSIEVVLLFVIICSCMTCAITRLQTFVEQHAREFSIHLFCGAQNKEIMLRLILQMFVPATFAFGLAALIYAYVGRLSIMIVACAALANLVIITGILLLPLLRFKKKSINILLKRSE